MKKKSAETNLVLSALKAVQPGDKIKNEKKSLAAENKGMSISGTLSYTTATTTEPILDTLFNLINTGVYIIDDAKNIVDINEAGCKIFGYAKEELVGNNSSMLLTIATPIEKLSIDHKTSINGTPIQAEWQAVHKDGSILYVTTGIKSLLHTNGKEYKIITVIDISEKIIATEKTKQSEENLKAIFDNTDEGFALIDNNFIVKTCNSTGRQNKFMLNIFQAGDNLLDFIEADRKELFKNSIINALNGKSTQYEKLTTHIETNEPLWLSFSINPVQLDGKIESVCITGRDITERKKKDLKIEQTESLLKRAESIAHIGSIENDYLINKCIWSDEFYRILGLEPGFIEATRDAFILFLHPEDKDYYLDTLNKKLIDKITFCQIETRIIRADGIERNIIAYAQATYDESGVLTKLLGVIKDITEQKEIERKIAQAQLLLNSAEKITRIGSAEINLITNKRIWSDQFYNIVGLAPGKISPAVDGILQFIHPEEKELYLKWLQNGLTNKIEVDQIELRIIKADDGEVRNIMAYGSAKYDANGKVETVISVIQDITAHKKLEQELAVNKEIYQSLFYQNPAAVFSLDMEGNLTSANNILFLKSGCSEAELLKMHYAAFVHPDDLAKTNQHFENTKLGKSQEYEIRIITPNGTHFYVLLINLPIIINNRITGVYCIANDITKEKADNILLNNTLAERQRILDCSLDVICEFDKEGNFLQVSKACIDLWGFKPEELIGKSFMDIVFKEDKISTLKKIADIIKEGPTRHFENRYSRKDGSVVTVIWSARWDENTNILYCIARDGTETKMKEEALGLSEQLYRNLFNNNPLPLFIFDFLTHQIIAVNEAALKKYGYSRNEFLLFTLKDLRPSSESSNIYEVLKEENTFENVAPRMWIHKKKNGELMYMNVTGNMIEYKGRKCVFSLMNDVTEKIKAESQKEFERRDKEALINTTDDQIWSVSKEFKFIAGNNAFINHINFTTNKIIKQGDYLLMKKNYSTDLLIFWHEMYYKALSGEAFKTEIISKDPFANNQQWREVSFQPIFNGIEICGIACYSRDITENKLYQNQLITINKKLKNAQQIAGLGYWEINLQKNTVFFSDELYHIYGFTKTNLPIQIQQIQDVIHADDKEFVLQAYKLAVEEKQPYNYEHRIVLKDGSIKVLVQKGNLVYDEKGIAVVLEGTSQDITERIQKEIILKELNGQLNKRAAELAASNAELEQFAYIASHDLQEPLRMVSSFLSLIQKKYEPQLDEAGQTYIRFAVDGAVRMRRIILDLLEYSRVGRQQYQFEKINISDILKESFQMYINIITEKKIFISYESMPDIIAAKIPIQQLFQNLISNAIKYQQPGSIPDIKISVTDKAAHWQFAVTDNGIGIDPEYFNKVFIIFQRLHSKDEYSGTGIGLAICKKIIDNHNGIIWVESMPEKGSTFYFTISKKLLVSEKIMNNKLLVK